LPLVSSLTTVLRWTSLSLGVGCLMLGTAGILPGSSALFDPGTRGFDSLSVLLCGPIFLVSHHFVRRSRLHASALALFAGLYLLSLLAALVRGGLGPGWYVQPLLAILVTSTLGAVPGLLLTSMGAVAILVSPWLPGSGTVAALPLSHSLSLSAVTLFAGLTGVLLHRLLLDAVGVGDELRQRFRHTRQALRQREKLLRHALRVETVGDLAAMVVHRLRNHFQIVLGHVTLGTRPDAEDQARHLEMIGQTVEESSPLLDQLLGLAHPEDGEPRPCDLNELAAEFSERARSILPSAVELHQRLDPGALPVLLDPRGLDHALLNLVINARDAMGGAGSVVISTGGRQEQVWISVQDSGPGIAEENLDRVFDPYFTTKPLGQGTGLGLTAVSRFASSSQGRVRVSSEAGRGATFTLTFPARSQPAEGSGARKGRATG
jgi:signal transduction histidine kinase